MDAQGGSGTVAGPPRRPTKAELQAAYGTVVPDLVRPGLSVLLCGINPSLMSGAVGLHFATPGNRLWPALHASGWTPRQLSPHETDALLACGCGITNLVERATARADELEDHEFRAGLQRLERVAEEHAPRWLAFLGLSAYRAATGERRASVGPQNRMIGPSRVWLLPNPSGLNASWQLPRLAEAYGALRQAARADAAGPGPRLPDAGPRPDVEDPKDVDRDRPGRPGSGGASPGRTQEQAAG